MGRFSVAAQSSLGTCGSILGDLHVYGPASVSVFVKFGSTAFVRACVQLGSLFSVDGEGQIGGSFSIFDIGSIGKTLSVRAFAAVVAGYMCSMTF